MTPGDRPKFLEIVLGFAELKGKQLSAPALELYWNAMQAWEIDEFREAANHLLRTCEFMPMPKDFEDLRKASDLSAGEAWSDVREIVRSGGSGHWDARVDAAVRALGGYRALGMTNTDQMHFLERRFAEHYETACEKSDVREALPELSNFTKKLPYNPNKFLEQS